MKLLLVALLTTLGAVSLALIVREGPRPEGGVGPVRGGAAFLVTGHLGS